MDINDLGPVLHSDGDHEPGLKMSWFKIQPGSYMINFS